MDRLEPGHSARPPPKGGAGALRDTRRPFGTERRTNFKRTLVLARQRLGVRQTSGAFLSRRADNSTSSYSPTVSILVFPS